MVPTPSTCWIAGVAWRWRRYEHFLSLFVPHLHVSRNGGAAVLMTMLITFQGERQAGGQGR